MRTVEVRVDDLVRPPSLDKRLFHFGATAKARGLPAKLVGCPFVTRGGMGGMLINQYLRARWLNKWNPRIDRASDRRPGGGEPVAADPFDLTSTSGSGRRTAPSSLDVIARNVDDFVGWWQALSDIRAAPDLSDRLREAGEHVIEEYGDSMHTGEWSFDGEPLSNSTIRGRQMDALQFLRWAKRQGKAPAFVLSVIETSVRKSTYSGATKIIKRSSYSIVRRPEPRRILFPEQDAVHAHVKAVQDPAAQLGAMLVYGCGLRASEVINLPKNPFAEGSSGGLEYVKVVGKGSKRRHVEIEAFIARHIRWYIGFSRSMTAPDPDVDRLLLRPDGTPFTYRAFYRAFRKAGPISPHLGRHWYAVNFLLKARTNRNASHVTDLEVLKLDLHAELIRLQANLGHADLTTTNGYLVALSQVLRPVDLFKAWEDLLVG